MSKGNEPAFGGSYDEVFVDSARSQDPFKIERRVKGLTKREWFAGMAMQGMIHCGYKDEDGLGKHSFKIADAMLKESEPKDE